MTRSSRATVFPHPTATSNTMTTTMTTTTNGKEEAEGAGGKAEQQQTTIPTQHPSSTAATSKAPDTCYLSGRSVVEVEAAKAVQTLSWHSVEYAVPLPKERGQMKRLLMNVHGEVTAGQVVAIMGGSGRASIGLGV